MSKTQDERLFDAIKQGVMELINSYRPDEDDEYQTTLERYFWNYIESNAGDIAESVIEEDFDAYEVYLGEKQEEENVVDIDSLHIKYRIGLGDGPIFYIDDED